MLDGRRGSGTTQAVRGSGTAPKGEAPGGGVDLEVSGEWGPVEIQWRRRILAREGPVRCLLRAEHNVAAAYHACVRVQVGAVNSIVLGGILVAD